MRERFATIVQSTVSEDRAEDNKVLCLRRESNRRDRLSRQQRSAPPDKRSYAQSSSWRTGTKIELEWGATLFIPKVAARYRSWQGHGPELVADCRTTENPRSITVPRQPCCQSPHVWSNVGRCKVLTPVRPSVTTDVIVHHRPCIRVAFGRVVLGLGDCEVNPRVLSLPGQRQRH